MRLRVRAIESERRDSRVRQLAPDSMLPKAAKSDLSYAHLDVIDGEGAIVVRVVAVRYAVRQRVVSCFCERVLDRYPTCLPAVLVPVVVRARRDVRR